MIIYTSSSLFFEPPNISKLLASVLLWSLHTLVTDHVATPVELAIALRHFLYLVRVVTTSTAQQIAALQSRPIPVALATDRAQWSLTQVLITVVRRVVDVNQLQSLRRLGVLLWIRHRTVAPLVDQPHLVSSGALHQPRFIVLSHQRVSHHAKRRKRPPTSLHCTRSWDAVAFTISSQ